MNIISIGNLEMGGTGKTPMVEYLVRMLIKSNTNSSNDGSSDDSNSSGNSITPIGIVTRGYGRKDKTPRLATPADTPATIGDEPMQYLQEFGNNVRIYVDANRIRGINALEKLNTIILDDGFRHQKVNPTLNILLTTWQRPYFNDRILPFGRLRGCRSSAKRADIIVVTKCPAALTEKEQNDFIKRINPLSHQKVFFATLEYKTPDITDKNITLATGIAHSEPLVKHLQQQGFNILKHLKYRDHHNYTKKEIDLLQNIKTPIFTTQKDKTKLPDMPNLYTVKVAHRFLFNSTEQFEENVLSLLKQ
ncbi:MAG: tetraacyldisaccharide 4'-kinase [Bacteroidales bacterium]|jgi:tetraacyldisaccharide 4'-kinase|nr:tetraacyldisaccharide 4'-kinase [Bacteroidales bacterium]